MTLLTSISNAQVNLERRCFTVEERNELAASLTEFEICKRNLEGCNRFADEVVKPEQDVADLVIAGAFGFAIGVIASGFLRR
jgi:hypothetical protein